MSKLVIKGGATGTGVFTLESPVTNTDRVLTLPDEAGTVLTTAGVPSSAMPAGSVLQVGVSTFEGLASSTANGLPTVITNGAGLFSLSFTPLSATSTLLVQTSSVSCHEESNSGDILWLALWNGSTFIAASSGRTISVRVGINAGTVYANGGSTLGYNLSGTNARIQMTVMEIAA